jgi:predicted phage-related endonuclease
MLTPENRAERLSGIGASEIAAVAGLSPWQTPLDVYAAKVAPVAVAENENMERGVELESALIGWTSRRPQCADLIIRPNDALYRSEAHPFCIATPDALGYQRGSLDRPVLDVEVKSPGNPDAWRDPADDPTGFPIYYA